MQLDDNFRSRRLPKKPVFCNFLFKVEDQREVQQKKGESEERMRVRRCCDAELGWIQTATELPACAHVCGSVAVAVAAAAAGRKECVS